MFRKCRYCRPGANTMRNIIVAIIFAKVIGILENQ